MECKCRSEFDDFWYSAEWRSTINQWRKFRMETVGNNVLFFTWSDWWCLVIFLDHCQVNCTVLKYASLRTTMAFSIILNRCLRKVWPFNAVSLYILTLRRISVTNNNNESRLLYYVEWTPGPLIIISFLNFVWKNKQIHCRNHRWIVLWIMRILAFVKY